MFGIAAAWPRYVREPHDLRVRPRTRICCLRSAAARSRLRQPFILLAVLTVVFMIVFRYTTWGRWVFALGGNGTCRAPDGVPVNRMKLSVYMLSALRAGISAVLLVAGRARAINAMGTGYRVAGDRVVVFGARI